jgi:DNA-binding transcriptional LysR family regulator
MDTTTLKLFIKAMRQRSFTEVARDERVAPSSVSRAIAGLEKEIGVLLFQRNTRKLEPTEAGLVFFERIVPLVDELEAAVQMATDISEEPRGTLRVSAPTVYGQRNIAPLLPELHADYPALAIELLLNDTFVDLIAEHIDVAIRLGSLQDSNLVATRLCDMRFRVCASPSYLERHGRPTSPHDIEQHECLLFPRQGYSLNWSFRDSAGKSIEVAVRGRCLVTNSDVIRQCAVSGMGLALLPDWLVDTDIHRGDLVTLFEEYEVTATNFDGTVWLLRPSRTYLPMKVRIFTDYLKNNLGQS